MIPTTSKWVRVDLLHPQMVSRLEHFFDDGRIKDCVKVVSACRSLADQQRLYAKYLNGTGNLAANPERVLPGGWKGSWHMQQDDGYCHAVDFRIVNSQSECVEHSVMDWPGVVKAIQAFRIAVGLWPIRRGSHGNVVMFVQQRLADLGFPSGRIDGKFGWRTKSAAKKFQKTRGLTSDGVIGQRSFDAMFT